MIVRLDNGRQLEIVQGDITRLAVDAIVNAANAALAGGGGVDGAIHRAGGPEIMRELDGIRAEHGGCPTGGAVVTSAGALPARFVFHAVGPRYRDGRHGEPEQLAAAYRACLSLAHEREVESLSFPAISTGIYGYPLREAADIALREIHEHLVRAAFPKRVVVVLFDAVALKEYQDACSRRNLT